MPRLRACAYLAREPVTSVLRSRLDKLGMFQLLSGDCLEVLKGLDDSSVDSLVTDPPAGISFMGKDWDSNKGGPKEWIAWMESVMRECLRVMKPGAHGLVWAIPRTSHWTATALENAGFEIRDVVTHLFGQGFPKSLDISKAIDKAAGHWRGKSEGLASRNAAMSGGNYLRTPKGEPITPSASASAWAGWGTSLKPASEHWILVRKPCSEKTVAANVIKWGTGGINIDGCRIEGAVPPTVQGQSARQDEVYGQDQREQRQFIGHAQGRFPANLVLSHSDHCTEETQLHFDTGKYESRWICAEDCPVKALDEQSGTLKSGANPSRRGSAKFKSAYGEFEGQAECTPARGPEQGGASRFFYCAKISPSERNAGLEGMPDRAFSRSNGGRAEVERGKEIPRAEVGSGFDSTAIVKNHHPTVKPQKLMRYLCRMITPPGGVVLDPFMGSGSTGIAAKLEGFRFIGIEKEPEYFGIARARIERAPTTDASAG